MYFNYSGWTSLMNAASGGHLDAVKLLLDHGAQINAVNNGGTRLYICSVTSSSLFISLYKYYNCFTFTSTILVIDTKIGSLRYVYHSPRHA